MPFLIAAVALVGSLCLVNLLLTLAVIRRLAEHSGRLAQVGPERSPFPTLGTKLGDFTTTLADGTTVTPAFFGGPTVVGVFSTSCSACRERLPEFTALLGRVKPEHALALVVGDRAEAEEFAGDLSAHVPVAIESRNGQMSKALQVSRYPSFYLIDEDALVIAATGVPDDLPVVANT